MMSQDAVAEVTPRHRLVYVDRQVDVQLDFDESTALLEWLEGELDRRTCGTGFTAVQGSANSGAI